ncbi:hypothetical protein EYC80_000675 [Monilinia laxa]|uniref:Uncharacterized protein n=1 Tax=Monilinia laxa TaxID=61186 RepID=A0A5N6KBL5_MONLA|nr:hypothetical protein EYC80_000675 [Monilinia laxa]
MTNMANSLQFNSTTSLPVISGRENDNINVLPVTPPRSRSVIVRNPKSPPTPTTPSRTTKEITTTVSDANKNASVSSVGPLPATPDHTPKSTPTGMQNTTHSSFISLPSSRSPPSIEFTSIPDPPVDDSSLAIKHTSDAKYVAFESGKNTGSFSGTFVPLLTPDFDSILSDLSLSPKPLRTITSTSISWLREDDILLYRAHTPQSKSPYSPEEGFKKNGRAFQAHCNAIPEPSPYISVHTSVARSVNFITKTELDTNPDAKVFVISLNLLEQLGITAKCTDLIFRSFGARYRKQGYIKYENGAIVAEMSMVEFLEVAKSEGISKEVLGRNGRSWDLNLEAQKIELHKWPGRTYREGKGEENEKKVVVDKDRNLGIRSGSTVQGTSTGANTDGLLLDGENTLSQLVDAMGNIGLDTESYLGVCHSLGISISYDVVYSQHYFIVRSFHSQLLSSYKTGTFGIYSFLSFASLISFLIGISS